MPKVAVAVAGANAIRRSRGEIAEGEDRRQAAILGVSTLFVLCFLYTCFVEGSAFSTVQKCVNLTTRGLPDLYRQGDWYVASGWDVFMIVFIASAISSLCTFLEEAITRTFPERGVIVMAEEQRSKLIYSIKLALFYILSTLYAAFVVVNIPMKLSTLWNGYPQDALPFHLKLYFLWLLGFWLQCISHIMSPVCGSKEQVQTATEISLAMSFIVFSLYFTCFAVVALLLLVVHNQCQLLYRTAEILCKYEDMQRFNYAMAFACHIVAGVEKTIACTLAFLVYMCGEDEHLDTLRLCYFGAGLAWVLFTVFRVYVTEDGQHPGYIGTDEYGFPDPNEGQRRARNAAGQLPVKRRLL